MKQIFLFFLLSISLISFSQSSQTDSLKVKYVLSVAGKRVTAISNDTTTRTTDSVELITKAAVKKLAGSGSSFNPSTPQTITANKWNFKNSIWIGENLASGMATDASTTTIGDWSGNGSLTQLVVDDGSQAVQSFGALQVWGQLDGIDYPTANAQISPQGQLSLPGVTIYQNGQIDVAEAIDLYPTGQADFASGGITIDAIGNFISNHYRLNLDGSVYFADSKFLVGSDGWVGNDAEGTWRVDPNGNASFRNVESYYTNEDNVYNSLALSCIGVSGSIDDNTGNIQSWNLGVNGLSYTYSEDGNDSYVSNWSIGVDGDIRIFNNGNSLQWLPNEGVFQINGFDRIENFMVDIPNGFVGIGDYVGDKNYTNIRLDDINQIIEFNALYGFSFYGDIQANSISIRNNTSLGEEVAYIKETDGSVWLDNGLITSDGNGNLKTKSIYCPTPETGESIETRINLENGFSVVYKSNDNIGGYVYSHLFRAFSGGIEFSNDADTHSIIDNQSLSYNRTFFLPDKDMTFAGLDDIGKLENLTEYEMNTIDNPQPGRLIFNSDSNSLCFYTDGGWKIVAADWY